LTNLGQRDEPSLNAVERVEPSESSFLFCAHDFDPAEVQEKITRWLHDKDTTPADVYDYLQTMFDKPGV
jgi:hypothetical protein